MTNQERRNQLYTERLSLESQLSASDYKVIKCAECQAAGGELPYDIESLHAERQSMRDRINAIEQEIAAIPEEEEAPVDMAEELITT